MQENVRGKKHCEVNYFLFPQCWWWIAIFLVGCFLGVLFSFVVFFSVANSVSFLLFFFSFKNVIFIQEL